MSIRTPLRKWERPKKLMEVYPSGRPPFYPFPTVTNLVNAAFCPVAVFHELLHGVYQDVTALPSTNWRLFGAGELFQDFIALLKSLIAKGELYLTGIDTIRHEFFSFARRIDDRTRDLLWDHYLEPWCRRKFEEIRKIKQGEQLFFEITASCAYVQFAHDGGTRTYPLLGVIDEIQIDNRKIIERTIKGKPEDNDPPNMKDYQVWLLWKILCSVNRSDYPEKWKNIDFSDFDLFVETPYRDFKVTKHNPEFDKYTHEAYAWIYDLTFDRRAEWEVYQHKRCAYAARRDECGLVGWCYRRKQPYPASRPEMRRVFKDMYRPLLWEQMWNYHLFQYKLVMLQLQALESIGLVSRGKIVSFSEGKFEVEVPADQADPMWARREVETRYMILPFGTFFVGKRIEATFKGRKGNRLIIEVPKQEIPTSETVLILPVKSDLPILETQPWYLTRWIQRDMFSLEYAGTKDPVRAGKDSIVQMLESLFGQKALRREGVEQS